MDEWVRDADDNKDCRAISKDFLERFTKTYQPKTKRPYDICLYKFVELVKEHPELAFCFRGNSNSGKQVCIYRNNHAMFTITPQKIHFDPNHLRYCSDWNSRLEELVSKLKFNNGEKPEPELIQKEQNGKISYSVEIKKRNLSRSINNLLLEQLDELYDCLTKIFDIYFNYKNDDESVWENHFREWYSDKHKNDREKIPRKQKKK